MLFSVSVDGLSWLNGIKMKGGGYIHTRDQNIIIILGGGKCYDFQLFADTDDHTNIELIFRFGGCCMACCTC